MSFYHQVADCQNTAIINLWVYLKSSPHHTFEVIIAQLGLRLGLGLVPVLVYGIMTANRLS